MTVETGTFCDHLQERKPPGLWEIVAEGMCVCVLGVGGGLAHGSLLVIQKGNLAGVGLPAGKRPGQAWEGRGHWPEC